MGRGSRNGRLVAAALAGLAGLAACRGVGVAKEKDLSFGDVQSIHVGVTAAQVTDAFGTPARTRRGPDGRIEVLDYPALDARGGRNRLVLRFDAREVLVSKTFTGAIVRPQ